MRGEAMVPRLPLRPLLGRVVGDALLAAVECVICKELAGLTSSREWQGMGAEEVPSAIVQELCLPVWYSSGCFLGELLNIFPERLPDLFAGSLGCASKELAQLLRLQREEPGSMNGTGGCCNSG